MSYENPVKEKNGCQIVFTTGPFDEASQVLLIQPGAGFGFKDLQSSLKHAIRVSDIIDYEVSFWFQQPTIDPCLTLSLDTFNADFIETKSYDITTALPEKFFIKQNQRIITNVNQWYFARYVIYGKNEDPKLGKQPQTSLSAGTNLVMGDRTNTIFVSLKCINQPILIWDFKIKPLRTPFSTGFVQSGHLLEIWRKNNNRTLSAEQVDTIAKQQLLPYNTGSSVISL